MEYKSKQTMGKRSVILYVFQSFQYMRPKIKQLTPELFTLHEISKLRPKYIKSRKLVCKEFPSNCKVSKHGSL